MIKSGVRTSDMVRERLQYLNQDRGWSWRSISKMDEFSPIPPGTLSAISKGYPVPHKWLYRLGLPATAPAPVCPLCNVVHLDRCPHQPPARRYGSGAQVVIRGKTNEVITHRRMDSRPYAPVLVIVREK